MGIGFFDLWGWPFMALGFGIMMIFVLIFLIFWIWAIIDCARRSFRNDVEKIVWIIVIVLGSWIGLLVYYIVISMYNPRGIAKK